VLESPDVGCGRTPLASRAFSPAIARITGRCSLGSGWAASGTASNHRHDHFDALPGMKLSRMPLLAWLNFGNVWNGLLAKLRPICGSAHVLWIAILAVIFFDTQAEGSATLWHAPFLIFGHPRFMSVISLLCVCFRNYSGFFTQANFRIPSCGCHVCIAL